MNDCVLAGKSGLGCPLIANVGRHEMEIGLVPHSRQCRHTSEQQRIENSHVELVADQMRHHCGTDVPGSTGHKNSHFVDHLAVNRTIVIGGSAVWLYSPTRFVAVRIESCSFAESP